MALSFLDHFKLARRVSTPLIVVRTPDPAATIASIATDDTSTPMILWDSVRGLTWVNEPLGKDLAKQLWKDNEPMSMANPVEMLIQAQKMPKKYAAARVRNLEIQPKLAMWPSIQPAFRKAKAHPTSTSHQALVVPAEPKQSDASEPRPNSTAWWLRENVRVGKAIIICKGCLASTVSDVSEPKQAAPTELSSTQAVR